MKCKYIDIDCETTNHICTFDNIGVCLDNAFSRILDLQDKISRRNMQIKELKEKIKNLIASYEYHCPEAKTQSIAVKNAKEELSQPIWNEKEKMWE